jgi:ABC-type transporter Mla maintaining outer membrane lipid asymmetry permease subunit MlaE
MNGTSAFGRVFATYFADIYGPFYLHVACTLVTAGTIWAVLGVSVVFLLLILLLNCCFIFQTQCLDSGASERFVWSVLRCGIALYVLVLKPTDMFIRRL